MATITTDTYLDGGTARTAGEAWTCNGGRLLIRTDSRWHANSPASMTGSLGSVTVSSTLGGGYEIDGTKVRWLPYDTGTGNVPAIGTNITQGGVASSYLLGVWSSLTAAPNAVGSAMPPSGFLKFREVSGAFAAGALAGIGANATAADVVGWIEVVHDQAANITIPRLGTGLKINGDWFYLGATTGAAGDTFQVPTNGGGAGTHIPGVQVETGNGTNVYEWWPCLDVTSGWSNTYIPTDIRGKLSQTVGGGVVRIGSDGTNNVGYVPPSGCKVRIPNIFGRQCTTAARASNASPHNTLTSRPELITTSAGAVQIDKFAADWYLRGASAYSFSLKDVATEGSIDTSNTPTAFLVESCSVGRYSTYAGFCLSFVTCLNGGVIKDNVVARHDSPSNGYSVNLSVCSGTEDYPILIEGNKVYASVAAARNGTAYAFSLVNCSYVTLQNNKQIGQGTYFNVCSNIKIYSIDHTDRLIGVTDSTTGLYVLRISYCKDFLADFGGTGLTFGLGGVIANNHPYTAVFYTVSCLGNVKIRNAGTYASQMNTGSGATRAGSVYISGGNEADIKVQRCYATDTRTLGFDAPNTTKSLLIEHVYGNLTQAQTVRCLDSTIRGCGFRNTTSPQTSVYGSHWLDGFDSATTGRVAFLANEPTTLTAPYITTTFGAGAGFTSTGNISMPNVGDRVIAETPYWIIGHSRFLGTTPSFTAVNPANFTLRYRLDSGTGWGAWTDLTAANLVAESISATTGFKMQIEFTTATAHVDNAVRFLHIFTETSAVIQASLFYPLDVVNTSLSFTGIEDGTTVKVYNSDYSVVLDTETLSGATTYSYPYVWDSNTGDFDVNVLFWKNDKAIIRIEALTLTDVGLSIPISQSEDLVYSTAATNATVDFANKLFIMSDDTEYVVDEMYSLWKDSILTGSNAQYDLAFSAIGGNTISGATAIPFYTYLDNDWQIRPFEADYTLNVTGGILLVDGGGDPFVDTTGAYTVRVNYQQPVQAIMVSTGGGGGATAAEVWSYGSRALTDKAGFSISGTKTTLDALTDVTAAQVVTAMQAVASDFKADVTNLDVAVSTRLASADYEEAPTAVEIREEIDTNGKGLKLGQFLALK